MYKTFVCSACEKEYRYTISNTRIRGPVINTVCPHCKLEIQRNITAFIDKQVDIEDNGISKARIMINMARTIGTRINDEPSFNKRKRK
jgi:hypothetical protein